jgi:UBA-like domain
MSDDSKIMQVMQFTGCTEDVARDALKKGNWDVIDALDRLTNIPKISGSKYIPTKPVVKDHLTGDVREKINQARQLADLLTYAPQNDLRGKASHYPENSQQERQKK